MNPRAVRWLWVVGVFLAVTGMPLMKLMQREPLLRLGLDLKGGTYMIARVEPFEGEILRPEDFNTVFQVIRRRLNPRGVAEVVVQRRGTNRLEIQLPADMDPERARKLISQTAHLEFVYPGSTPLDVDTELTEEMRENLNLETIMTGEALQQAEVSYDQTSLQPVVTFRLKPDYAARFYRFTDEHINEYLCIVLDNRVISCPVIRTAIPGGTGQIEGGFTLEEAQDLASMLNAGRLPARVFVEHETRVGPILGHTSLVQSMRALGIGVLLLAIYLLLVYRLNGVVALISLGYYLYVLTALLITFDVTLTLYGIAGLILSLGMAVDANILIYERILEELRAGKTTLAAVEAGHKGALTAIVDSNLTTIGTTIILYFFGTGTIKGFALTLGIGVGASMFAALVFTRALLEVLSRTTARPWLYGIRAT